MRYDIRGVEREKKRSGFTLVEMLMVLSLITILVTVTAVYNKSIGKQIVVAQQHAKVLGILIKARSAGFTIPKSLDVICGYGVHVDPATRTFVFFKDLGGSSSATCDTSASNTYNGASEKIEQVVLDPSLTVTSDMTDIVFIPPFGKVKINNSDTKVSATITIKSVDAGVTKTVKVNSYGQITE